MLEKDQKSSLTSVDVFWVLGCFILSGFLAWQGWKSLAYDIHDDSVPLIESAGAFLLTGSVPEYGLISTYSSLNPPGSAWLYMPGVLLFSDYRLFAAGGALLLHIGTLAGLFLLVNRIFGRPAARLAVLFYAFSEFGLFLAGSLWPRAHPFFTVWFVLCVDEWRAKQNSRFLALTLVLFAAGMYVHLELAPLFVVVPAVWYLYRPPISRAWVLLGILISMLIWFPYLQYEANRGFKDVTSQLLRQEILPADHARLYCDADLRAEVIRRNFQSCDYGLPCDHGYSDKTKTYLFFREHALGFVQGLTSTTESIFAPFVSLLALLALSRFAPPWVFAGQPKREVDRTRLVSGIILCLSAATLMIAVYAKHWSSTPEDWGQAQRLVLVFTLPGFLVGMYQMLRAMPHSFTAIQKCTDSQKVFALATLFPWVILLFIAESDGARRFWFLWPLQAGLIAFFLKDTLRRWCGPAFSWVAQAVFLISFLASPALLEKLSNWKSDGWSGADSDLSKALEFLAQEAQRTHGGHVSVGYSLPGTVWDAPYQAIDPRVFIGLGPNYILTQHHGIRNPNRCPEGISQEDVYRLVLLEPDTDPAPFLRLRRRSLADFRTLRKFGSYAVVVRGLG